MKKEKGICKTLNEIDDLIAIGENKKQSTKELQIKYIEVEWKEIKDYPNYEVSNTGFVRVKNINKKGFIVFGGKILAFRKGGYNKQYLRVYLQNNKIRKDKYIHRLVLEHFDRLPKRNEQAAHLDRNPLNNNISNLKWTSPKENSQMKIIHGTSGKGSTNSVAKLSDHEVQIILKSYSNGITTPKLASIFNLSQENVSAITSRRTWKHLKIDKIVIKNIKFMKLYNMQKGIINANNTNRSKKVNCI